MLVIPNLANPGDRLKPVFEPPAFNVPLRPQRFELARDTVWWHRVNYFVSLILVFIAVAFPLLAAYLRLPGVIDQSEVAVCSHW
jgi:hypothetical protein